MIYQAFVADGGDVISPG